MRRILALLVLGLILAAPAAAQERGRIQVIKAPTPTLRGPVGETPANEANPDAPPGGGLADLIPVPPPVAPTASRISRDNRQCRRACSQAYYFCLSAEDEICPTAWTKCMAGCGS
jgi:hypothetical protein